MSRIALGCYPLGGGYGQVSMRQAEATIATAIDCGWTFFDTAEAYLDSEERLGNLLGKRRDQVFLATKVFPCEPYSAVNLRAALEGSLRRLRTDRIDLYQLHGPEDWVLPDAATPLEEVAGTLRDLRDEGKIRYIGACNLTADDVATLDSIAGLFAVQDLYNILDPGVDHDLPHLPSVSKKLSYAAEHDVRFIAYSPLARGLLSDGLPATREFPSDDERHYLPRYQPDSYPHFAALAATLAAWAHDHGRTLRELAVAWCLHNPTVSSVLVGAKTPDQVMQIAGAQSWRLSAQDVEFVAAAVATLPPSAAQALVTVWDHFSADAHNRLRQRRHQWMAPDARV
jgi:aryl-alcohol dehydrogenase-like predicted oxidoreductase